MAQEKKNLKPNFKQVTSSAYKGIRSGETAVGMGKGGRGTQAGQSSVSKILKPVTDIVNKPLQEVAGGIKSGVSFVLEKTGIAGDYRRRKAATRQMGQQREILGMVGDSTKPARTIAPALQTGTPKPAMSTDTASKPAMSTDTGSHLMPAGAPSVLSANKMTGGLMTDESTGERYSIAGGRGGNMMKVGADGTIDTGFKERSIQRPNLNLMDKPKMVGGYEVSDSTWTKDEAERFGRQPGRGATFAERGFVQGATGGSGRSIGGQSSGDPLEMARKILGPMKIDTKGFSGTGAQARAHTQEVSYNERLAKLAGELTQTSMQQGGQTDRAIMGAESDIARASLVGDIQAKLQRERFSLRGAEADVKAATDSQSQRERFGLREKEADVKASRAAVESEKGRLFDLYKDSRPDALSAKDKTELKGSVDEMYSMAGGDKEFGEISEFISAEMPWLTGIFGGDKQGGSSIRGMSFGDMLD